MKNINDDVTILGTLTVDKVGGFFIAELIEHLNSLNTRLDEINKKIGEQCENLATITERYNNAVIVINDLSERVTALESNYDPTVIK